MKAKVTKAFSGLPDGATQVRQIQVGEVITGSLAKVAVDEKWAEEVSGDSELAALSEMTVPQLKDFAAERDIDLGDNTKKADIIAAIQLASGA